MVNRSVWDEESQTWFVVDLEDDDENPNKPTRINKTDREIERLAHEIHDPVRATPLAWIGLGFATIGVMASIPVYFFMVYWALWIPLWLFGVSTWTDLKYSFLWFWAFLLFWWACSFIADLLIGRRAT